MFHKDSWMAVYYMKKCFIKIKTKPLLKCPMFYKNPKNQGVYAQLSSVLIFSKGYKK